MKISQIFCEHVFKLSELSERDKSGYVTWKCERCGRVFKEECGLDVLKHGKVKSEGFTK